MKILDNNAVQTPAVQLARLSGSHGYRFDGDTVHLNAMFSLLDPDAHDRSWALQLWACPAVPDSSSDLAGHIVAEVALPPMGELADETEHFAVSAFASPPAGIGEYAMVLVLASGRPGEFNDVHDFAIYPRNEQFIQPRIGGMVGYLIHGGRVQLSVERIENQRPSENISGTLSLELWALTEPFSGRRFQGHHLAGVDIGTLNGQNELTLAPIDLAFHQPPAGRWQIAVLLREWTSNGFVTRDFTNFAAPFISESVVEPTPAPVVEKAVAHAIEKAAAPAVEKAVTPVIQQTVAPVIEKTMAAVTEKPVAPVIEKAVTPVIEKVVAPVNHVAVAPPVEKAVLPLVPKTPAPEVGKALEPVAVKAPAPAPAPLKAPTAQTAVAPAASAKSPVGSSARGVSINTARVEELTAVKGLTAKLAEGIVKKRPFTSLDDLRRVKGLGPALLEKVRSSLRL